MSLVICNENASQFKNSLSQRYFLFYNLTFLFEGEHFFLDPKKQIYFLFFLFSLFFFGGTKLLEIEHMHFSANTTYI
jgi:hypothetical protein